MQSTKCEGWKYSPLRMLFDIKQEGLRHKVRLVLGGNRVDASEYITYWSTVQSLSVRLLLVIAVVCNLAIMTGDISNAFLTANIQEKVFSVSGPEFGHQQG